MSDHGMGWPGGWSDPSHAARSQDTTPLAAALGNQLFTNELDAALATIRQQTGLAKLELVGLDACLMGQLEVYSMLAKHANYAVASEETEPGLGWAYSGFLSELAAKPTMDGAALGKLIVDSYIVEDQRIVDDVARAEMLRQGSPMGGGLFSYAAPTSAEVANQMGRAATLSAVDLAMVPSVVEQLNGLCATLQGQNQRPMAQARNYAQSFTSIFGEQVPASYVDLGNWLHLLKQAGASASVNQAADQVWSAMQTAIIAEKHGAGKAGATGMAIYFPNSQLYRAPVAGPASYTAIAESFARDSLWDDYLTHHYTGRAFDASAREPAVPESGANVTAPGGGEIALTQVQVSNPVAAPGAPVVLSTDISGGNLGYMLLVAGYYDSAANSVLMYDMDYLQSEDTREVDGVYYPVWPEGAFTLEFEWEPLVYYISNGSDQALALLTPATYGATAEDAVYTTDGIYSFASGEQLQARLYFRDGVLRQVFGFTGGTSAAAPREIYPQTGDSFTVAEQWLDLDAQGRVVKRSYQKGGTLTFSDSMFTWEEMDAAAGDYMVGFIATDLDGNQQQAYAQVRVQ